MDANLFMLEFLNNIDIFLLILVRITGFIMLLPIFSGNSIPVIAKIIFIIPLALMVYTGGAVSQVAYGDTIGGLFFLIVKEFIVGLTISFVVYTVFSVMYMAGQLIDYQIGFSMVNVLDPVNQIQVPVTGNLMYLLMAALLVFTGGLDAFIGAVYKSFDVLPIGEAAVLDNPYIASMMLKLVTDYIYIGVQIAIPIIGTILVLDVALGLLVKAAPQMNVFVVGMPMKLLVGLVVFYFVVPVFSDVYNALFEAAYKGIINVIEGMLP